MFRKSRATATRLLPYTLAEAKKKERPETKKGGRRTAQGRPEPSLRAG